MDSTTTNNPVVNSEEFSSHCWIPDWLMVRTELKPIDKMVYGCLYFEGRNDGWARQTVEYYSTVLRTTTKRIRRHLKVLEDHGLISLSGPRSTTPILLLDHPWVSDINLDAE